MFNSISWEQYFLFLLIAVIAYYFCVWVTYFEAKDFSFFRKGERQFLVYEEELPSNVPPNSQKIIEEIMPSFIGRKNKNELIYALHIILKKCSQWDEPGFREKVNEFILKESEIKCSIRLNEEDLRAVWM